MQQTMAKCVVLFLILMAGAMAWADEGTSDIDFDYEPPAETGMFSAFTEVFARTFFRPAHAGTYSTAKKRLYARIKDEKTFYCGCSADPGARTFDPQGCGYEPRNDNDRAKRLEAEHVVPAFWIANFHDGDSCWQKSSSCGGARECCLANDERFKTAHNDLVNLLPTIGELNGDRSNYIYDILDAEPRNYGSCDFEVASDLKLTEPLEAIRGDIARVFFYMRETYNLVYPVDIAERLQHWNEIDPVSNSERERNKRVLETQGTSNSFVQ